MTDASTRRTARFATAVSAAEVWSCEGYASANAIDPQRRYASRRSPESAPSRSRCSLNASVTTHELGIAEPTSATAVVATIASGAVRWRVSSAASVIHERLRGFVV